MIVPHATPTHATSPHPHRASINPYAPFPSQHRRTPPPPPLPCLHALPVPGQPLHPPAQHTPALGHAAQRSCRGRRGSRWAAATRRPTALARGSALVGCGRRDCRWAAAAALARLSALLCLLIKDGCTLPVLLLLSVFVVIRFFFLWRRPARGLVRQGAQLPV